MEVEARPRWGMQSAAFIFMCVWVAAGCARLPYTTKVLHEDSRVVVSVQQEVNPAGYTHPVQLAPAEVAAILKGFTLREQQRLPLRWFAEEAPPKPIFREDELQALAPPLADALAKIRPDEHAHFEVIAPGLNPSMRKDVVGGWVAVRNPFFYLTMEYFHTQIPTHKSDLYDYNYPTPPPVAKEYLLYFEPGRFWVTDLKGERAVEYQQFLKSAEASGAGRSRSVPSNRVP